MKNTHGGVLVLVKLQGKVPPWVFFTFSKLCKGTKSRNAPHIEYLKHYEKTFRFFKFCELRKKWCIPVGGASGIHSVCVCEHRQNFKLLTSQLPEISDYKELLSKIAILTIVTVCREAVMSVLYLI